jgi:peroxiredoxin
MAQKLAGGDKFPSMTLELTGGGQLHLPGDLSSDYTVVLFYRGHW